MQDTSFRVKKFYLLLYCAYDDAFSGDDAQQLSCSGSDEASGHYGRDYFAGSVFHLSGVSDVPFFFRGFRKQLWILPELMAQES